MYKIQQKIEVVNGKLVVDHLKLGDLVKLLNDGHGVLTIELLGASTIEDFRRQYFKIRDTIAKETGNDQDTVHKMIKKEVLSDIVINPMYLTQESVDVLTRVCAGDAETLVWYIKKHISTKWLNEAGWKIFIENTRIWAFTGLNIST